MFTKSKKTIIKIANAHAFWGDNQDAARDLLKLQPDLDYITMDYLSEVSLSIMAAQQLKDLKSGYAKDFIDVVLSLIPFWKNGSTVRLIVNAGGLNPFACAQACHEKIKNEGLHLKIGVVEGDNVLNFLKQDPTHTLFKHLDTKESLENIYERLQTANAYLGAKPIVEALKLGADIVITGRVADPSLALAPCMARFAWDWTDYDKIAQATIAGHLIECGTQVTGGIYTDWLTLPHLENLGFPIAEIDEDGHVTITKAKDTGGAVNIAIVKEQLLYEIGDPNVILTPDAIISILSICLEQVGKDRVAVTGTKGKKASTNYKVSATYQSGYRAEGTLAIFGKECRRKAQLSGEIILSKMKQAGFSPKKSLIECLGTGDIVPGIPLLKKGNDFLNQQVEECILRIAVADSKIDVLNNFIKQIAPLVTSGAPGTTGYTNGRPKIHPIFGYWPCLIEKQQVFPKITIL